MYIAGIFLFADSPVVSDIAPFNPYSLLHIPLYGILTLLLLLSFPPQRKTFIIAPNSTNPMNSMNPMNFLVAGIIALVVAIADEIHQAYIPGRNPSVIDVILDVIGIILSIILSIIVLRQIQGKSGWSKKRGIPAQN